jgi:hypothetical protein
LNNLTKTTDTNQVSEIESVVHPLNKKHQVKVKELKLQYNQLKMKLAALKSDDAADDKGSNAGDAFGGRAAMSKKPA